MDWTLFIVTPLWAVLSVFLFLQGLLATINLVIALAASMRGIIPPKNFLAATIASCLAALVFFSLLIVGFYVMTVKIPVAQTHEGQITYDIFALLAALYIIPKMALRIKRQWRKCMMPGVAEIDAAVRKSGNE
jgi:hypothetical protein